MVLPSLLSTIRRHFLRYRPVVEIFIHKKNIIHNYNLYKTTYPKNAIAPVLKSNAYGHGLVEVAKILEPLKPPFIIIDSIFEAYRLRRAGIVSPLLVIGYTLPENIVSSKLKNTEFGITAIETLEYLSKNLKKPVRVQLKFDTGMHRHGIDCAKLQYAHELVQKNKNILVTGIFSHLADPDNTDTTFTQKQISTWNSLTAQCRVLFSAAKHYHLAATFGSAFCAQIDSNLIRLGIGLYGCNTSPHQKNLQQKPALELKTLISSIRTVGAGESVGYGCTFTAKNPTILATIPVGYFEGLDRRLSNNCSIAVGNTPVPIAGRISMNITSLDVTVKPDTKVGDTVTVISSNPTNQNSIIQMAELSKTITYDLLVHIPPHLRRTVI